MTLKKDDVIIVTIYTENTPYEDYAERLEASCKKFNLKIKKIPFESKGNWKRNCFQKPYLVMDCLSNFDDKMIWYLDADAEIVSEPAFEAISEEKPSFICWRRWFWKRGKLFEPGWRRKFEIISASFFLPTKPTSFDVMNKWIFELNKTKWQNHVIGEQLALQASLEEGCFEKLELKFSKIFDNMRLVRKPYVIQHQASRKHKYKKSI